MDISPLDRPRIQYIFHFTFIVAYVLYQMFQSPKQLNAIHLVPSVLCSGFCILCSVFSVQYSMCLGFKLKYMINAFVK